MTMAVTITEAIKDSSRDKLFQKLGFEYLQQRRRMRRLCLTYKLLSTGQLSHTHKLLPQMRNTHRHPNIFHAFLCRTE